MRIKRSDNERLVVVHFPLFLALLAMVPAMTTVFVAYGSVTGLFIPPPKGQSAWMGVLFFLLFSLVWAGLFAFVVKKVTYDFDLVGRRLAWSRRGLYGKKEGTISLDDIRGATVDSQWSSDSGRTYCPVLSTTNGMFPLLNYYNTHKYEYERIAAAVNAALKANPAAAMEDEILKLISQGDSQWLSAIQMVQKRYGYDLPQARQFVDALTDRLSREQKQA